MKTDRKKLVLSLAVGAAAALLTGDGIKGYASLSRPALSPPAWLFPVVWTALYVLMGIAAYLIAAATVEKSKRRTALGCYALQLALNFFWPIAFFNLRAYWFAFVWLVLLLLLVFVTAVLFYRIKPAAGWLLLPYLFWCAFAAYLNYAVAVLN